MKFRVSALLALMLVVPAHVLAGVFTVTSVLDDGSSGTLRWAINQANGSPGSTITFDSSLTGKTITLSSDLPALSASAMIDGNGAAGALTVDGQGLYQVLSMGGENLFVTISSLTVNGPAVISSGTLQTGSPNVISTRTAVSLDDNSKLDLQSKNQNIGSLASAAAASVNGSSVTLGSAQLTTGNDGTDTAYIGIISGTGSLIKVGTGTFTLGGNNTYTGATQINGGALQMGTGNALSTATAVSLSNGSVFNLQGYNQRIGSLADDGSGTSVTLGSATLTTGGNGTSTMFAGIISDNGQNGSLVKIGTGTLTLSGQNTYGGATVIDGGALRMGIANAISATSAVSLADGATFNLNGNDQEIGSLASTGTASVNGSSVILGSATLIAGDNGISTTYLGVISGTGSLNKSGSGTLTLGGNNTYTGATQINGGVLQMGIENALSTGTAVSLNNGSAFDLQGYNQNIGALSDNVGGTRVTLGTATLTTGNEGTNTIYDGIISGDGGSLVKVGTGTFTLGGANTYTGATQINGGVLQMNTNNALSIATAVSLSSGTTFDLQSNNQSIGSLSGVAGSSVTLGGAKLTVGNDDTSTTYSGSISDGGNGGSLVKMGTGTFTLAGHNTYIGATRIKDGVLQMGTENAISQNSDVSLSNGSTFDLQGYNQGIGSLSDNVGGTSVMLGTATLTVGFNNGMTSYDGTISGAGSLKIDGGGTLQLGGSSGNSYTGSTIINNGNLTALTYNVLASSSAFIVSDNGALTVNNSQNIGSLASAPGATPNVGSVFLNRNSILYTGNDGTSTTFVGNISGSGSLVKVGSGTFTVSDNNSYSGGTQINGGTLQMGIVDAISGNVSLSNSAGNGAVFNLNGYNQIIGSLTDDDTGTSVMLGTATLTITKGGGGASYSGTISGGGSLVVETGKNNPLQLGGVNTYTGATLIGDSNNSGYLSVARNNVLASSSAFILSNGSVLDISGSNAQSIGSLSDDGTDYGKICGYGLNCVELGGAALTVGYDNTSSIFSGVIQDGGANGGSGGSLVKVGTGTLTLTSSNTYTGGTTINGGVLSISRDSNLGDTYAESAITFGGGTLQTTSAFTSTRAIVLNGRGAIDTYANEDDLFGNISGSGSLSLINSLGTAGGLVVLYGSNTYTGGTTIDGVRLQAASANVLGTGGVSLISESSQSADLNLYGFNQNIGSLSGDSASTLELGGATLAVGSDGTNTTFAGVISDSDTVMGGSLIKVGTGTLTLTNQRNTYSGGTEIDNGILAVSYVGCLGLSGSTVAFNGGALRFNNNSILDQYLLLNNGGGTVDTVGNSVEIQDAVSGSGALTKTGAGLLTLDAANSYQGGTFIDSGTLSISRDANLGAAGTSITFDGGTLRTTSAMTFTRDLALNAGGGTWDTYGTSSTLTGTISGSGSFTKTGAGMLTLNGTDTYGGGTFVNQGTLQAGRVDAFGTGTVSLADDPGAVLDLNGFNQTIGSLSGGGASGGNIVLGTATLTTGGDNTYTSYGGIISGAGSLVKTGTGTFTLAGNNTYTGGTTVSAGTLLAGEANVFGAGTISLANTSGAALDLNGFDQNIMSLAGGGMSGGNVILGTATLTTGSDNTDTSYGGIVSGAGSLVKTGTGTFTLAGNNTYTGGTTVDAGTLRAGAANVFGAGTISLANVSGAALDLNGYDQSIASLSGGGAGGGNVMLGTATLTTGGDNTDTSYGGIISGAGSLVKTGTGTFTLTGASAYTGGTFIDNGVLRMGAANALWNAGAVTVGSGGIYDLNGFNQEIGSFVNNGRTQLYTASLKVNGSYSGSGTLATTLQSNASYGRLNVTGTASLSGSALQVILLAPYIPAASDSFTVVTAANVDGRFMNVIQPAALSFSVAYGTTSVILYASTGTEVPYSKSAANPNQLAVSTVLDQLRHGATGDMATVVGNLNILTTSQLQSAFQQMSPSALNSIPQSSLSNADAQFNAVTQRMAAVLNGTAGSAFALYNATGQNDTPVTLLAYAGDDLQRMLYGTSFEFSGYPEAPPACQGFASGVGAFGRLDSVTNSAGLTPGYDFNTNGVNFGGDCRIGEHTTVGVSGGFLLSHTDLDMNSNTVDGQSIQFGTYGMQQFNNLNITGYVGGGIDSYKTSRNIAFGALNRTASASPGGRDFDTRWGLEYDYKTSYATVQPLASMQYSRVEVNAFSEDGAGALDMRVDPQVMESLRSEAGVRLLRMFRYGRRRVTPHFSSTWQHEYMDQSQSISAQFLTGGDVFTVRTADAGRDTAVIGAGIDVLWNTVLSLYANYHGEFGRANFVSHNFDGGVRLRF